MKSNLLVCYEKAPPRQGPRASSVIGTRPQLLQPQSLCWRTQASGQSTWGSRSKGEWRRFQCEAGDSTTRVRWEDTAPLWAKSRFQWRVSDFPHKKKYKQVDGQKHILHHSRWMDTVLWKPTWWYASRDLKLSPIPFLKLYQKHTCTRARAYTHTHTHTHRG